MAVRRAAGSAGKSTNARDRFFVLVFLLGFVNFFLGVGMFCYYCNDGKPVGNEVVIGGLPEIREFAVLDTAGVLSAETHDYFNRGSRKLQQANGGEIFVATFRDLPAYDSGGVMAHAPDINDLATFLFNSIGLGSRKRNNGVLILFTTGEPHVVLRTGAGIGHCIPDGKAGRILDNYAVSDMKARRWNHAAVNTWNAVARELYRCYGNNVPPDVGYSYAKLQEGTSDFYEATPALTGHATSAETKGVIFFFLAFGDGILLMIFLCTDGTKSGRSVRIRRVGNSHDNDGFGGSNFGGGGFGGGGGGFGGGHGGGFSGGGGASR